jgi:hypothetical protein
MGGKAITERTTTMLIRYDIDNLAEAIRPFRHRADDRRDPLMAALREGRPVKLIEREGFDATETRRLAKRLTDRARRRGLRQTTSTTREGQKRVITVQWYRETPGDLLDPPASTAGLSLLEPGTA